MVSHQGLGKTRVRRFRITQAEPGWLAPTRVGNNLPPVSGAVVAPEVFPGRGDSKTTPGGAVGIFVGTDPTGLDWYAYRPQDFLELCSHFDRRTK